MIGQVQEWLEIKSKQAKEKRKKKDLMPMG